MTETIHCIGYNAIIQAENPHELGYIPKAVSEKGMETEEVYCQRCFRLGHYNGIQDVQLTDDDFLRLLNGLGTEDALIVNAVGIFDFNGSLIPGLYRFIGGNPVLSVGNEVDISPRSLRKPGMVQWTRERAHEAGLRPVDVLLTSGKKPQEIQGLLDAIEKYREDRDVYVIGVTNAGKSTLVSQIIQQTMDVQDVITTSQFPGTTLDRIEIPLDDNHFLINTPGIIHRHQMAHYLGKKDLKIITPQKEIKPRVYQLNAEQTLFLDDLVRFGCVQGVKSSFIACVSNNLKLHQTKTATADAFYEKHADGLLWPPRAGEVTEFPKLVRFEFSVKEKTDIVFVGLGWITVTEPGVVADWAPKGVDVLRRKTLI